MTPNGEPGGHLNVWFFFDAETLRRGNQWSRHSPASKSLTEGRKQFSKSAIIRQTFSQKRKVLSSAHSRNQHAPAHLHYMGLNPRTKSKTHHLIYWESNSGLSKLEPFPPHTHIHPVRGSADSRQNIDLNRCNRTRQRPGPDNDQLGPHNDRLLCGPRHIFRTRQRPIEVVVTQS